MKRILVAMDSFKGCLGSYEAGGAVARGFADEGFSGAEVVAMADGGEGMAEAVRLNAGGLRVEVEAHDPLMRPLRTSYTMLDEGAAYMDLAAACGLPLLSPEERDPMAATTFGLGEMMADALGRGASRLVIGFGGSATNDGGLGALCRLGLICRDRRGLLLPPQVDGSMLREIGSMDLFALRKAIEGVELQLLCDVDSPLAGPNGAASVFAPQKGADSRSVALLEEGLLTAAEAAHRACGEDPAAVAGGGAAGGAAAFFSALCGARTSPGAEALASLFGLAGRCAGCSLLVTGEGHSDRQTLMGKAPSLLLGLGREAGVDVVLLSGGVSDREKLLKAGFREAVSINEGFPADGTELDPRVAASRLRQAARILARAYLG